MACCLTPMTIVGSLRTQNSRVLYLLAPSSVMYQGRITTKMSRSTKMTLTVSNLNTLSRTLFRPSNLSMLNVFGLSHYTNARTWH